jgi:hypothetical protein
MDHLPAWTKLLHLGEEGRTLLGHSIYCTPLF